jgi:hypothetical protein
LVVKRKNDERSSEETGNRAFGPKNNYCGLRQAGGSLTERRALTWGRGKVEVAVWGRMTKVWWKKLAMEYLGLKSRMMGQDKLGKA